MTRRISCYGIITLAFAALSHGFLHTKTFYRRSKFVLSVSTSDIIDKYPFQQGIVQVSRDDKGFELAYRIFRPMSLSSRQAAPIVALHGGPSVPSNYLYPLVEHVPYRSIVFYDQLGCGDSDEPKSDVYSIERSVQDLQTVLNKLQIRRYHLYGQSFGGILAYEFLKRQHQENQDDDEGCLSVILSSTPTNVTQVELAAQELIDDLDDPSLFRETHQCRTKGMPTVLSEAYAKAGTQWRGTTAIAGYFASPPTPELSRMPSCMALRGEFDFVTSECIEPWKSVWNHKFVRLKTLDDCSHHGLLEHGSVYGSIVDSFFGEYD